MIELRKTLFVALSPLLAALAACATPGGGAPAPLSDILEDDAPLRAWFDRESDAPRAILLLSPV